MIPYPKLERTQFKALHNIKSSISRQSWEKTLLNQTPVTPQKTIIFHAGSKHHIELEANYTIGYVDFILARPESPASTLHITYFERYEDTPTKLPYLRSKSNRLDTSKQLIDPSDTYTFHGLLYSSSTLHYDSHEQTREIYTPFYTRTFRLLALHITICTSSSLTLHTIKITNTH
ncbi:hypothetical protein T440DRAFT_558591 [Plenodomus tracheiphilus IPT5]|uniref:Uncharacterized protein n=1 Tax=Plenodomus tracheiphilus IPT5 TaxID=1408161 RepID=A0A6A7AUD2_9PLEO|nr:hypothetical protein T440DRAFT_558591 [Plenodomus tracheiphilus IPT5]